MSLEGGGAAGGGRLSGGLDSMREATASVRAVVGLQTQEERNQSCFPELSYQTRVYGVMICFAMGTVLSVFSTLLLSTGNVTGFAIVYSMGNLLALFSSVFMMGIKRQCSLMWRQHRAVASGVYFLAMICTIVVAFAASHPAAPCLVLILVQFAAATWYTLSYIPFARRACLSCMGFPSGGSGAAASGTGV